MEQVYELAGGVTVSRMQPTIGASISGIDIAGGVSAEQVESLKQALYAHGVVVLRGQDAMSFDDHLGFAAIFGDPISEGHVPDRPQITPVTGKVGSKEGTACYWHSDGVYKPEPEFASILRAVDPCTFGGDTSWSSGVAAYANLPDEVKRQLRDMRFNSSLTARMPKDYNHFGDGDNWNKLHEKYPPVTQPAVSAHPVTGALALYVNQSWSIDIVGMDEGESAAMVAMLTAEIKRPEYQCRWQWQKGDVAIWDNRLVQHYGVPDHTTGRYLERITVANGPVLSIADWEASGAKVKVVA
ncbi:MAG: TauD/TfdA family dioxygenase [Novosphingobium sp.]|nr:TauD/TfdA family dioxygenase [Novosphingobium sp.]